MRCHRIIARARMLNHSYSLYQFALKVKSVTDALIRELCMGTREVSLLNLDSRIKEMSTVSTFRGIKVRNAYTGCPTHFHPFQA